MDRRSLSIISVAVMAIVAIAASVAVAGTVTGKGNSLSADFKISPKKLSKKAPTPAALEVTAKTTTTDPSGVPSPTMHAVMDFDKSGKYYAKGLATCGEKRVRSKTDRVAARICKKALIGTGRVSAGVALFESAPFDAKAKLTAFNGVPKGGKPTVLLHAYTTRPVAAAYIFEGVISKYNKQGYGSRFEIDFPPLFGGSGAIREFNLKLSKKFSYKGKKRSLISAKCPKSKKLKARYAFTYKNGETLTAPATQSCKPKK